MSTSRIAKMAAEAVQPQIADLFRDKQIVSVVRGKECRAVLIRVYWPDGWHTDHEVLDEPEQQS